jgi:hypothetical protein
MLFDWHASLLRSVVRIHPPAADEIGHGGSDRIRLLNDHEMPGARDIHDFLPRCFLSARDSESVGALLAGTGLHPLMALRASRQHGMIDGDVAGFCRM